MAQARVPVSEQGEEEIQETREKRGLVKEAANGHKESSSSRDLYLCRLGL